MKEEIDTIPTCCGSPMTEETFDFYSCPKCNGEAEWDNEEGWRYDCPYGEPPKTW